MAEKLLVSKYTYLFTSSNGKKLVYNSRTNAFLEVNQELYDKLQDYKQKNQAVKELEDDITKSLYSRKILVKTEDDEDFLLEMQYETDRRSYSKYIMGLTIVPTLACNFSCHYCFEEKKRSLSMTEEVEDALITFINAHKESQKLNLNWYGGEPLLALNTIERLLDKISDKTTLELNRHTLITNGYFINDKVISLFKRYPLDIIQITLDGNRERHNSIRKMKNDSNTYERILKNMERILHEFPNIQIHVRVNIERKNVKDYIEVAQEFKNRWNDKRLVVYPGFLRLDNETKTAYNCDSLDRQEIAELMFELRDKNIIDLPIYPQLQLAKTCSANRQCAYIVGPEGEIYKCWNDVSDSTKIVGYIQNNKITNKSLLSKYIVASKWYNDSMCKECFFLPICNGTCSWYVLRNKYMNGKYNLCTCIQKAPGMLDKCLEYYYNLQKK